MTMTMPYPLLEASPGLERGLARVPVLPFDLFTLAPLSESSSTTHTRVAILVRQKKDRTLDKNRHTQQPRLRKRVFIFSL